MFKKLAKSGLVKFRLVQPQRIASPGLNEATLLSNSSYFNDNLPGFRRPTAVGKRRSPSPALACHWFDRDGRLECCWLPETDDAPSGGFDEHQPGRGSARTPIQSRDLALVR